MNGLKIKGLTAFQQIDQEETADMMLNFIVTDPRIITHSIAFWRQEAKNEYATAESVAKAEEMVQLWLKVAEIQAIVTSKFFSFDSEDTDNEVVDATTTPKSEVKPDDVKLKIVKGDSNVIAPDEDRILRVKYEKLIKKINIDALKQMCIDLYKAGKDDEAKEAATFLLTKGLYTGKKVKQWSMDKVNNFLESCKPVKVASSDDSTETPEPTEATVETPDVEIAVDETSDDLHKKYANYIGDHAVTLAALKVETKLSLQHGDLETALERANFILSEGLVAGDEKKWSFAEIEAWFAAIKQELKDDPDNLVGPKPKVDVYMKDLYPQIKERIMSTEVTEEEIKAYVLNEVKTKNVENLTDFRRDNVTQKELEDMYAQYFLGFVASTYNVKKAKTLDITEEIAKFIKIGIDLKEKTFASAVQHTMTLFRQRGEKPDLKEVKEMVYNIGKDKYPDEYAVAMDILNKANSDTKPKEKVTVVSGDDGTIDFPKMHPEVWESVKGFNPQCLDDVYNIARELEKTQSFLIVSELIIYLISSGKIKNADGILISEDDNTMWDRAQIELWINSLFGKVETVDEAKSKEVNPTPPATESQDVKAGAGEETVITATSTTEDTDNAQQQTDADSGVAHPTDADQRKDSTTNVDQNTSGSDNAASSGAKTTDKVATETVTDVELGVSKHYAFPEDRIPFKGLYAKKKEAFWDAFAQNLIRLEKEGMSQKDIIHTMADVIKSIATNDDMTQCFARNFVKTRMDEMNKLIPIKAAKYEVPGWVDVK